MRAAWTILLVVVSVMLAACGGSIDDRTVPGAPAGSSPEPSRIPGTSTTAPTREASASTPAPTAAVPLASRFGEKVMFPSGASAQTHGIQGWSVIAERVGRFSILADTSQRPAAQTNFLAVNVEVCAPDKLPDGRLHHADRLHFELVLANSTRVKAGDTLPWSGTGRPMKSVDLEAGECARGWVVFELPGSAPTEYVAYSALDVDGQMLLALWTLAQSSS